MLCPFRVNVEFEYCEINGAVVVSSQIEKYPECDEDECPFYGWDGCGRVHEE